MTFLSSLFLIAKSQTLTLTEASEDFGSLEGVLGSFFTPEWVIEIF